MTVCVCVHVDMHVYQSVHGLYDFPYASGYSIDERSNARIDIKTAHAAVLNAGLLTITTLLTYRYTHQDYLVIAGDAGFVDDDGKKHAENGNDHDALLKRKHALLICAAFCLQFSLCSSLVLLPVVRCDAATLATCPSPLHLLLLLSVVNAAAVANAAAASTATPSTPWP